MDVETLIGNAPQWVEYALTNVGGSVGFWILIAMVIAAVAGSVANALGDLVTSFVVEHRAALVGVGLPLLVAAGSMVGFGVEGGSATVWVPMLVGLVAGGLWAVAGYLAGEAVWRRRAGWAFGIAYPATLLVVGYLPGLSAPRALGQAIAVVMPTDARQPDLSYETFSNLHLSLASLSHASERIVIAPRTRSRTFYEKYLDEWPNPLEIYELDALDRLGRFHEVAANDVDVVIVAAVNACDEQGRFFRLRVWPYPVDREKRRASSLAWDQDIGVYGESTAVELVGLVMGFELARVLSEHSEDFHPMSVAQHRNVDQFRVFLKRLVDSDKLEASAEIVSRLTDAARPLDATELAEIMGHFREQLDTRAKEAQGGCEQAGRSSMKAVEVRYAGK